MRLGIKFRQLSLILSVITVMSCVLVPASVYADATYYTEAEVLGDVAEGEKIDFTGGDLEALKSSGGFNNYKNTATEKISHDAISGEGLKVISKTGYTAGYSPSIFDYTLGTNGAFKVTFKTDGTGQFQMNFQSAADNMRVRFYMADGKLGYYGQADGDANVGHRTFGEVFAANTWHTYIIKKEGTKIAYYKQASDGRYEKVISYTPGAAASNALKIENCVQDGSVTIKELTQYTDKPEVVEFSEDEIIGSNAKGRCINFAGGTVDTLKLNGSYSNISGGAEYTATSEGLAMKSIADPKDSAKIIGAGYTPYGFKHSLGTSGAFKITFKTDETGQLQLNLYSGDGYRLRFYMQGGRLGYYGQADGDANVGHRTFGKVLAADTWHTYIIKKENGKISYYKLIDDDTYEKVITYTAGGYSGNSSMKIECTTAGSVTIKEFSQYLDPKESRRILSTESEIVKGEFQTMIDEDFEATNENWNGSGYEIKDGALKLDIGSDTSNHEAYISTDSFDTSKTYQIYMKLKINDKWARGNFGWGGKRLLWSIDKSTISFGASASGGQAKIDTIFGAWYEYMFEFVGISKVNAYRRELGTDLWETILENVPTSDWTNNRLHFYASTDENVSYEVDDLKAFEGMYVSVKDPVISGSTVGVEGEVYFGTPKTTYDRRVNVAAVAYDKTHGYTSKIASENMTAYAEERNKIDKSLELTGIDSAKNDISLIVWDSFDTAYPLTGAKGYQTKNNAADDMTATDIAYETDYNEVRIYGNAGKVCDVTATLTDSSGKVVSAMQTSTNKRGMVDSLMAIDPYECKSGSYTLRIAYGGNVSKTYTVKLSCNDIAYNGISDKASFVTFLNTYADADIKDIVANETLVEGMYNVFNVKKDNKDFSDIYAFREAVDYAAQYATTERELLTAVNEAVKNEKWSALETLITATYKDFLGVDLTKMSDVKSTKDMFMRMLDTEYTTMQDIIDAYEDAAEDQLEAEKTPSGGNNGNNGNNGNGGSGGGGGGSASGSFTKADSDKTEIKGENGSLPTTSENIENLTDILVEDFTDLSSVEWAADSINMLKRYGIVSGDEKGNFNPNNSVTREEFLKMLMGVASITSADGELPDFDDVDKDEWYSVYVNSAYALGIVKGVSDRSFGIGVNITRGDMAVMIKRVVDMKGIKIDAVKPAFVFDDFDKIPDYALDSIAYLCEGGILNGTGDNKFDSDASATRAEAATALYRVYGLLK